MTFNRQAQRAMADVPVLPIEHHYRITLASLPQLSQEQTQDLIQRARLGENVRDEIILSLQRRIYALSAKYQTRYQHQDGMIERMDLIQAANEAMLRYWPAFLSWDNPIRYLLRVAGSAMYRCISGRSDLIKSYSDQQRVTVLSLDCPPCENGTTLIEIVPFEAPHPSSLSRAVPSLYQAIETLPEMQRTVIKRHFGLDTQPESLSAIGRSLAPQLQHPIKHSYYHKKRALAALRQRLTPLLPLLMGGDASC